MLSHDPRGTIARPADLRPSGHRQGRDHLVLPVAVPEQELQRSHPDVRLGELSGGPRPLERRVDVRAPLRVVLPPGEVKLELIDFGGIHDTADQMLDDEDTAEIEEA